MDPVGACYRISLAPSHRNRPCVGDTGGGGVCAFAAAGEHGGSIRWRKTAGSSGTDRSVRAGTATTNPDKDCSASTNCCLISCVFDCLFHEFYVGVFLVLIWFFSFWRIWCFFSLNVLKGNYVTLNSKLMVFSLVLSPLTLPTLPDPIKGQSTQTLSRPPRTTTTATTTTKKKRAVRRGF